MMVMSPAAICLWRVHVRIALEWTLQREVTPPRICTNQCRETTDVLKNLSVPTSALWYIDARFKLLVLECPAQGG